MIKLDTSGKSLASVHHRKKFQPAPKTGRGLSFGDEPTPTLQWCRRPAKLSG
jgi:hypothetical protein